MRLHHHEPGEPRMRQHAAAEQRLRRLPVLHPLAGEGIALLIEGNDAAALDPGAFQREPETIAVACVGLQTRGFVVLDAAAEPPACLHEVQAADRGVPQPVATAPTVPGPRPGPSALRQVLADEAAGAPQPEPAAAVLDGLLVLEGEPAFRDCPLNGALGALPAVGAPDMGAVLAQGHSAEGGDPAA